MPIMCTDELIRLFMLGKEVSERSQLTFCINPECNPENMECYYYEVIIIMTYFS